MPRKADVRDLVLHDLRSGDVRAGQSVPVVDMARRCRLSPIPVREALAQLVGEAVLAEQPRAGFFVPVLHAHELVQLYRLRQLLVRGAIETVFRGVARPAGHSLPATEAVDELLAALLAMAEDRMLAEAWVRTEHRLLPYRHAEPAPDQAERQIGDELRRAFAAGDGRRVTQSVARHIRRRSDASAATIKAALHPDISRI